MSTHTIADLTGDYLEHAIEAVARRYKTAEGLGRNRASALRMPDVAQFHEDRFDLVDRAMQLAMQVEGILTLDAQKRASSEGSAVTEYAQNIEAVCSEHDVPMVVAVATLPQNVDPATHDFKHSDLIHSFHTERINNGRIHCDIHPGNEAEIHKVGNTIRISQREKRDGREVSHVVAEELARRTFSRRMGLSSAEFEEEVREALDIIFRVGDIYDSAYEGFVQVRGRAITPPFIAKSARLAGLPDSVKRLIDYRSFVKSPSLLEGARFLASRPFFVALDEVIAENVHSPYIVIKDRVKGAESFTEKLVLRKHWGEILDAYASGALQEHFDRLGLPLPRMKEQPPNLGDYLSIRVLVHDDEINYDYDDLVKGSVPLTPEQRQRLTRKMYDIFEDFAGISITYARQDQSTEHNGRRIKTRMPADPNKPEFQTGHWENRGLVINMEPGKTFDDYLISPKESGYIGLHATVQSIIDGHEGAVVELQINPNFMINLERFSGEKYQYKAAGAGMLHYLRHSGLVTPMEWETHKLLFTPPRREFRETQIAMTELR